MRRSLIEGVVAIAGLGILVAPQDAPSFRKLVKPFLEAATPQESSPYQLSSHLAHLTTEENPDAGSVRFYDGMREAYEFDLRLGLIFDHADNQRMYDLRYTTPPPQLLAAYTAVKTQFCAKHRVAQDVPSENLDRYCPPVTPAPEQPS